MTLALYNDAADDMPIQEVEGGFFELNNTLSPPLLTAGTLARAKNVWMDGDGLVRLRPGLRLVSNVQAASASPIGGMMYYDTPEREAVLVASGADLWAVSGLTPGQVPAKIVEAIHPATGRKTFAQLVDRAIWTGGVGLHWARWAAGAWTSGSVATFSDGAAMPAFRTTAVHRFRLFAVGEDSDVIYPSKILQAETPADWVQTQSIRVGTGSGDPVVAMLSGQDANLIVLNQGSAWQVDTTDAESANWIVRKLTDKLGCVAGATAVQTGGDVLFLSRHGVVALGSLASTDSLSAARGLSAPIMETLNRINWAAVDSPYGARATMWRNLYLLALPIDGATWANRVLAYNTKTQKWVGEWETDNASLAGAVSGWGLSVVAHFEEQEQTLWSDIDGGLYRLDDTYVKDDTLAGGSVDMESLVRTRALAFGAPAQMKQPFWLEAEFYRSSAPTASLMLVFDEEAAYPEVDIDHARVALRDFSVTDEQRLPLRLPFVFSTRYVRRVPCHVRRFPRFREMAVQLQSKAGNLSLRSLRVAAWIDSVPLSG